MMTDMMKTVLLSGTGTNAAISGIYQAGKTGTSNYADNEIGKLTKNAYSNIVTPDELFVGYTPEYAMASMDRLFQSLYNQYWIMEYRSQRMSTVK